MIRTPRRAWQSAVALWLVAAAGTLLMPDARPAKAVLAKMDDVRAILDARSPGAREDGALYQTKLALLDRYDGGNHERVLGGERDHPGGGAAGAGGDPLGGGGPVGGDPLPNPGGGGGDGALGDDWGGPVASFAVGGIGALPAVGGLVGGGSGGGGGGGTGGGGATTSPALPEPATWLCMIIGFLAVGAMTRRRPGLVLQGLR